MDTIKRQRLSEDLSTTSQSTSCRLNGDNLLDEIHRCYHYWKAIYKTELLPNEATPENSLIFQQAVAQLEARRATETDYIKFESLMARLDSPQDRYMTIHVTGTNGKGTVCTKIADDLQAYPIFPIGLFTSPHIRTRCELLALLKAIQLVVDTDGSLKFFQICTLIAFLWFHLKNVKVAVVEVGIGGRLDPTNVISAPICSVITSIGLDHTEYLGETITQIASEKAGIIKPNSYLIVGPGIDKEAMEVILVQAQAKQVPVVRPDIDYSDEYEYEKINGVIAQTVVNQVVQSRFDLNPLKLPLSSQTPPARIQHVLPNFIVDGGHNAPAMTALAKYLAKRSSSIYLAVALSKRRSLRIFNPLIDILGGKLQEVRYLHYCHSLARSHTMLSRDLNNEDVKRAHFVKDMSIVGGWQAAPAPEANPHLYVHNVPKDSNEEELRTVFGQYGTVANVRLKVNQKVGPHAVYAFVTFNSTEEARNALLNLQGKDLRGRSLRIEFQRAATGTGNNSNRTMQGQPQSQMPQVQQSSNFCRPDQPPPKRNRSETQLPGVRYVASNDQTGLIDAIKHVSSSVKHTLFQLLIVQRPDLVESFSKFCDRWLGASLSKSNGAWPPSQLSAQQQRLASEGNLELDSETGRWGVLLNKLIGNEDGVVVLQPQARDSFLGTTSQGMISHSEPPQLFATALNNSGGDEDLSNPSSTAGAAQECNDSGLAQLWEDKVRQMQPTLSDIEAWSGTMNRNEKRVLPVSLKLLAGELPPILTAAPVLSITLRSPYEEMLKKSFVGLGVLTLQQQGDREQLAQLQDYITYFETKNRAGVAKLTENDYAYIFPTLVFPPFIGESADVNALMIVFAKSSESP